MTTFNAYYRIIAAKDGVTAAEYETVDYEEALDMYIDYVKGFGDYNDFLRRLGRDETDYVITLDMINNDKVFEKIRKMEV